MVLMHVKKQEAAKYTILFESLLFIIKPKCCLKKIFLGKRD